ncbi:MAG: hypothetical protein E6G19_01850 [Actinobacteria bacterium]|nr:MAG: hypothetical protein E6G19_01850 [Actinomycetota bacterium]
MKEGDPAYAIVRVDLDTKDDEARFSVSQVVWSEDLAEAEVLRLRELNADKGCGYFWRYTRVDRQLLG